MDLFQGNIPKSVINWAAKVAVPSFVNNLKSACLQYEKEYPGDASFDTLDVIRVQIICYEYEIDFELIKKIDDVNYMFFGM